MKVKQHFPQLVCKDGTRLSVQASRYHYCNPREDVGPYTEVEMGYPSVPPTGELLELAEDQASPCNTVYPYVPVALIEDYIAAHGGLDLSVTLNTNNFHE